MLAMAMAVLACSVGAAQAAPLEAYGKLPAMDMVTLSPDGNKVAFVHPVNGKDTVVVDQISPAMALTGQSGIAERVRFLDWADPTRLIVARSNSGWLIAQVVDVAKRKAAPLFDPNGTTGLVVNAIARRPESRNLNGHTTVFGLGFGGWSGLALVSVDLETSHRSVIEMSTNSTQTLNWYIDNDGRPYAQETYDDPNHLYAIRLRRSGAWTNAYSTKVLIDQPSAMGLSPDGSALIVAFSTDGDIQFRPLVLADGRLGEPVEAYANLSILITDPVSHRIIGGKTMEMEPDYIFFDPKDQAAWNVVTSSFQGEEVERVSWSDDRTKIVVQVTGLQHGVAYELVDLRAHKAMEIGQAYDGLKPDDVADVRLVTYPAGDGRPIRAFLTLPNGREPKGLPLVVLPHDGPASRDQPGFDWLAQALASRGYAVLQPQFRGSAGLGRGLESAGFGEWGRKMQSDLSDGVHALASLGMIDPKRVCIVGNGGYAGYAALAGVILQQGVYRCAVSVAGVPDLRMIVGDKSVDASKDYRVRYWDRFVGAKNPGDPVFDQLSPAKHAAQASAPILLIHGRDDLAVPIAQSVIMAEKLRAANKQVQIVTLPGEDHWLSGEETRLQMLRSTVTFLEANNPPG